MGQAEARKRLPHLSLNFPPRSTDPFYVMVADDPTELELMLQRFRRLLNDIVRGATARNAFECWEVEILLDLANCDVLPRRRIEVLRQYERAVARQMELGPGPPMKLSQYLQQRTTRRPSIR